MYSKLPEVTFDQAFKEIKQNSHLSVINDNKLYFYNNNKSAAFLLPTMIILVYNLQLLLNSTDIIINLDAHHIIETNFTIFPLSFSLCTMINSKNRICYNLFPLYFTSLINLQRPFSRILSAFLVLI